MTEPGAWLPGGSEMAARVRAFDWAATPLGPIESWPPELRTSAAFVLENRFPAALIWGANLITIYNDAFRPILGEKPEALGQSFADIWSEVWDDIRPFAERAFAGESTFIEDFELTVHRHGRPEKACFTFSYSPVRAADGTIVGMIDTVIETTRTVQSQASLQASREQFESLLNQAPLGVYLVDADFVISQVNPIALPVFGDIPGGPIGRDFDEVIHILWDKTYADELVRIFRHTLETGEPYVTPERAEYRIDRNITEYYEWRVDRIPLSGGRFGVVCYFRDISAQVRARQEIENQREVARESEAKFAALFDNMAEGYALFGVVRSPAGPIVDLIYREANKALEDQTGLVRANVIGQPLTAFLTPADAGRWASIFARAIDLGEPVILEDYSETVDRWFSVSAYSHGDDAIAVFYKDITERKRAETVLLEDEARQAFLLKLSDALRPLADPFAVQVEAMRVIGQHLAVNRAQYHEMEPNNEWIAPGGGYANGVALHPAPSRMNDFGAFVREAYEAGQTLIVTDTDADARVGDALRAAWAGIGVRAFIAVPLVKNGRLVAVFGLDHATPRSWTQAEIALAEDVAERTWAAVERARAEALRQESEAKYRTLFEKMREGFSVLERVPGEPVDYRFLAANPAYQHHTGLSDPVGRTIREITPGVEDSALDSYRNVEETRVAQTVVTHVPDIDRWFEIEASPVNQPGQIAVLFKDITERRRAEEASRENEARQAFLLKLSDTLRAEPSAEAIADRAVGMLFEEMGLDRCFIGIFFLEEDRAEYHHQVHDDRLPPLPAEVRISDFPEALQVLLDGSLVIDNIDEKEGFSDDERANIEALGLHALIDVTLRKGEKNPLWAIIAGSKQPRAWTKGEITLVEEVAERTWAAIERKRAELALKEGADHQALLLAELQHRVRNSLTMVRSLTRRTAENSNDIDDYVRHLDGRLSALARIQTSLTRNPKAGVSLRDLVLDELTSQATMPAQYEIDGPEVALSAKAAEVLSLAIHELTTNSVKYGVLGEISGTIRIQWIVVDRAGQDWLCFTWNEPLASKIGRPVRTGFGSELIKNRVPYELRGTGNIRIGVDEVEATIDFPLAAGQSKFDNVAATGT